MRLLELVERGRIGGADHVEDPAREVKNRGWSRGLQAATSTQ